MKVHNATKMPLTRSFAITVPRKIDQLIERDGPQCHYCGRELALPEMTQDHIVPRRRFEGKRGPNALWNLVIACQPCNRRKGDAEWHPDCERCNAARAQHQNTPLDQDGLYRRGAHLVGKMSDPYPWRRKEVMVDKHGYPLHESFKDDEDPLDPEGPCYPAVREGGG